MNRKEDQNPSSHSCQSDIFIANLLLIVNLNGESEQSRKTEADQNMPPFEKILKKHSISNYFRSREASKNRRSMTPPRKIMDIIDPSDELLKFDIDKVKLPKYKEGPKILNDSRRYINDSRRYFQPPGKVLPLSHVSEHRDSYNLRARLYELMKQTVYEARDAITVIQELRDEYNWHSLYKMGFLFSKTDDQTKLFSQLSHKFFHFCRTAREQMSNTDDRLDPTLLNEAYERLLNHWLETDMLVDIIRVNDASARKTLRSMKNLNELDNWFIEEFTDVYHVQKLVQKERAAKRKMKALLEELTKKKKKKEQDEERGYASDEIQNNETSQ